MDGKHQQTITKNFHVGGRAIPKSYVTKSASARWSQPYVASAPQIIQRRKQYPPKPVLAAIAFCGYRKAIFRCILRIYIFRLAWDVRSPKSSQGFLVEKSQQSYEVLGVVSHPVAIFWTCACQCMKHRLRDKTAISCAKVFENTLGFGTIVVDEVFAIIVLEVFRERLPILLDIISESVVQASAKTKKSMRYFDPNLIYVQLLANNVLCIEQTRPYRVASNH